MSGIRHSRAMRDQIAAAARELEAAGLRWWVEGKGKHVKVRVTAPGGGVHHLAVSSTPKSPDEAVQSMGQIARRLVRQLKGEG